MPFTFQWANLACEYMSKALARFWLRISTTLRLVSSGRSTRFLYMRLARAGVASVFSGAVFFAMIFVPLFNPYVDSRGLDADGKATISFRKGTAQDSVTRLVF